MTINIRQSLYAEIAEFIVSQPSLEAIVAYQLPADAQQWLDEALDKNREEGLSVDERDALEKVLALSHLMNLAKAKARVRLMEQ